MSKIEDVVKLGPVIPVLAFDSAEQGEHVSRALHAGGVKVLEITLRTAAGLAAIERASQLADDIVVGVGTITKPEHCALSLIHISEPTRPSHISRMPSSA